MNDVHSAASESEAGKVLESIYTTDQLIKAAKDGTGQKLSVDQRRQCTAHLMLTEPNLTNGAIAELFGISESMVRKDKGLIDEARVKETLININPNVLISNLLLTFDAQLWALENSRDKSKKGSRDYVMHCKAIVDIAEKRLHLLQSLDLVPTSFGIERKTKFDYAAIVLKGDQIDTRSLDMFDQDTQKKLAVAKKKQIPAPEEKVIDIVATPTVERQVVFAPSQLLIRKEE